MRSIRSRVFKALLLVFVSSSSYHSSSRPAVTPMPEPPGPVAKMEDPTFVPNESSLPLFGGKVESRIYALPFSSRSSRLSHLSCAPASKGLSPLPLVEFFKPSFVHISFLILENEIVKGWFVQIDFSNSQPFRSACFSSLKVTFRTEDHKANALVIRHFMSKQYQVDPERREISAPNVLYLTRDTHWFEVVISSLKWLKYAIWTVT